MVSLSRGDSASMPTSLTISSSRASSCKILLISVLYAVNCASTLRVNQSASLSLYSE